MTRGIFLFYECSSEIQCPDLPSSSLLTWRLNSTLYNETALPVCIVGYRVSSMIENITCLANGQWSYDPRMFQCQSTTRLLQITLKLFPFLILTNMLTLNVSVVDCGEIPRIQFALPEQVTVNTYGVVIVYICNHGYWFSNKQNWRSITCLDTGLWSENISKCHREFATRVCFLVTGFQQSTLHRE